MQLEFMHVFIEFHFFFFLERRHRTKHVCLNLVDFTFPLSTNWLELDIIAIDKWQKR